MTGLGRGHIVVGRLGFEPRYTPPEGAVLPLDDLPLVILE